ncbi:MAG: DnaA N-terminal domain-containing protein [Planctomycetota bacterium]
MQNIITDEISAINKVLTEKIGLQKFRIWFENSTRFSLVDGYLKVGVPNLFIAGWIESHFLQELRDSVRSVTGGSQRIMFTVDPELSGQQRKSKQVTGEFKKEWTHQPKGTNKSTVSKKRKKLKLNFSTFVVGRSNELAFNAAKAVVSEEKSPFIGPERIGYIFRRKIL